MIAAIAIPAIAPIASISTILARRAVGARRSGGGQLLLGRRRKKRLTR